MEWQGDWAAMRRVNVEATAELPAAAQALPHFQRFVHVSGYLVTADAFWRAAGLDRARMVAEPRYARRGFRRLARDGGAYEVTKMEADILVRRARAGGLPAVIINPATVLGHAQTGEAQQLFGIEGFITGLETGSLAAIPGRPDDWLPFVSIDYLAAFMARAPFLDWAPGQDFTILNAGSPAISRTAAIIAEELGKKAPRHFVPVWLLRPLLKAGLERKTGTPAETLGFINAYRFDTAAADRAAVELGLAQADIEETLRRSIRARQQRSGLPAAA
jgi:nucleoside-diphosphate-sugar epimerase